MFREICTRGLKIAKKVEITKLQLENRRNRETDLERILIPERRDRQLRESQHS